MWGDHGPTNFDSLDAMEKGKVSKKRQDTFCPDERLQDYFWTKESFDPASGATVSAGCFDPGCTGADYDHGDLSVLMDKAIAAMLWTASTHLNLEVYLTDASKNRVASCEIDITASGPSVNNPTCRSKDPGPRSCNACQNGWC